MKERAGSSITFSQEGAMGRINVGRVIVGGLVAGLVINFGEYLLNEPVLGEQWKAAMAALNKPPVGGGSIAWFMIQGFLMGIAVVWLYAAMRPRFGAGPKTAILAGLIMWFFAAFCGFGSTAIIGLFPGHLVGLTLAWELVEGPLAALAGAWVYREDGPA
jgi:hypothetical protein